MPEPIISQTFSGKTGAVVGADFDEAFGDIVAKFDGGIDNANIAANAAIDWRKLGSPYHVYEVERVLLPDNAGPTGGVVAGPPNTMPTWVSVLTDFQLDGTPRTVRKSIIRLDSNELLWLCEIAIYVLDITSVGGAYPQVTVYKNGTLIPGATATLTEDDTSQPNTPFRLYRTNPFANPLISFGDSDVLEYRLGRSAAAGPPRARGIVATEWWKRTPV